MSIIKGYVQPKIEEKTKNSFATDLMGVGVLQESLSKFKQDVIKILDTKVSEINNLIEEIKQTTEDNNQKVDDKVAEFENTAIGLIQDIKNIPHFVGPQGDPGTPADEEKVVEAVLSKIPAAPKVDEKTLVQRVLKAIPENKASLKIIQEKFEVDPMSVIDKILDLPDSKFKLKTSNIDGLDQTISAFRHQITNRGYIHGGGDTVVAGSNVTITTNAAGKKVISSSGAGTWYEESFTLTASQSSVTLAHTPLSANSLYVLYQSPGGTGAAFYPLIQTLQWSLAVATVSFAPATVGDVIVIKYQG